MGQALIIFLMFCRAEEGEIWSSLHASLLKGRLLKKRQGNCNTEKKSEFCPQTFCNKTLQGVSYDAVIHASCVSWHSADCFMPCTREWFQLSLPPGRLSPQAGMAAGLGSPSAAIYSIFSFDSQSCGCLGQAWHLPNPSWLQYIFPYLISRSKPRAF